MIIGIDASRAFHKQRTGVEEYSYQIIKHLRDKLDNAQVVLYLRRQQKIDFGLPDNWKIKIIKWPLLWTQVGLSLEMLFHPVEVLFIPAHVVPFIHSQNAIVTIHGLEYEIMPEAYHVWQRLYMRWSIKLSCRWASKIIAVSKNTKEDLIRLYKVPEEKIEVVYEGINIVIASEAKQSQNNNNEIAMSPAKRDPLNDNIEPYILFVGRLEKRKNIEGIISAFEALKEKYKIPHKLVLVGKLGYGYLNFPPKADQPLAGKFKEDIIETGFVSEKKKYDLLKNADVFLFPSFYEGFGLPVLEAQNAGTPVVASNVSSIPEITNGSAVLADPHEPKVIADAVYKLISDKNYRDSIIEKGYENVKRFSWDKCAKRITELIME